LTSVIGRTTNQDYPGVEGLSIKELSYWNRKVMLPEAEKLRYHQIDPTKTNSLLSYYRLSGSYPEVINFATENPNYAFEDSNPQFLYTGWEPNYNTRTEL
jgi:hypothetical protein